MKKSLTILLGMALVFSMVCCVGVVAGANVEITPDANGDPSINGALGTNNVTTSVEFSVSRGYEIVIPDTIKIGKDGGSGSAHISVDIGNIDANHYVNVVIDDPEYGGVNRYYNTTGKFWEMKNSDEYIKFYVGVSGFGDTQGYQHINISATESPLKPNNGVFSVPADVKTYVEATIHCLIPDYQNINVDYSGDYKGKLKFVVSIDDEPKAAETGVVVNHNGMFEPSKGLGYPTS